MKIVVDSNKLFASFITKGIVHDLLFSAKFESVGPEKLLKEVEKHRFELAEKSGLNIENIELAIKLLEYEFKIFPREGYADKFPEAKEISPHEKDVEFFALALKFDFPIWSNERAFKQQSRVKVFSTKELIEFLSKAKP